jgi:hypothetical protein
MYALGWPVSVYAYLLNSMFSGLGMCLVIACSQARCALLGCGVLLCRLADQVVLHGCNPNSVCLWQLPLQLEGNLKSGDPGRAVTWCSLLAVVYAALTLASRWPGLLPGPLHDGSGWLTISSGLFKLVLAWPGPVRTW